MRTLWILISALIISTGTHAQQAGSIDTEGMPLSTGQKLTLLKSHDTAFQALNERIRDPFVLPGPDGWYYVTGTTAGSHWGETIGIRLWRSRDLAEWEDMGFVWELYENGNPRDTWHFSYPAKNPEYKNPKAVWAPEIHYLNETWWIPHCLNGGGHGLLKSTSGKPEGPYEVMPNISTQGIDAHLFQEADGTTYYMWGADNLARMDDEMRKLAEEPMELKHDGKHPLGYEGILLLKLENLYLHIASGRYGYEPANTYDLYYCVSKQIEGPYGKRRMAVKNAGHGNLFMDKQGRWWCTAFDHEYCSKQMDKWSLWLVPVDITVTENDILIDVKDPRFQPKQEDQTVVQELSQTGIPEEWNGKAPWYRPAP